MNELLRIVNGHVPGGIYLLGMVLLVYLIVNVYLLKVSPLFDKKKFYKWVITGYVIIFLLYAFIWRLNPPIIPKTRIMIGPIYDRTESSTLGWSEWFREFFPFQKNNNVYLMNWLWVYPSCYEVSGHTRLEQMDSLIYKSNPEIWIYGKVLGEKTLMLYLKKNLKLEDSLRISNVSTILPRVQEWIHKNKVPVIIQQKNGKYNQNLYETIGRLAQLYFSKKYSEVEEVLKEDEVRKFNHPMIWYFKCLAESQLAFKEKQNAPPKNPLEVKKTSWEIKFSHARKELLELSQKGVLDVDILNALAESFLLEEKFGYADAFLKQALTLTAQHYKTFYLLSFLHPSRLQEIHLKNEIAVLEKAYFINPIDEKTVVRYARYIFDSALPVSSQKQMAIELVKEYLRINPYSYLAIMKLAYFYMYQNRVAEALRLYERAEKIWPDDQTIQFDKAIAFMENKQYDKAISLFNALKNHPGFEDAYAYLGKIYKERGEYKKALENFRKRVRMKKSDNDQVALEAMKGIRQTLIEMEEKGLLHEQDLPENIGK